MKTADAPVQAPTHAFASFLWPDHVIGRRESRAIREEHNALVNAHAALLAENAALRAAMESASALILTARAHFPKSMHHADRFQLELTCAAIGTALNR